MTLDGCQQNENTLASAALQHGYKESWAERDISEAKELDLSLSQRNDLWTVQGVQHLQQVDAKLVDEGSSRNLTMRRIAHLRFTYTDAQVTTESCLLSIMTILPQLPSYQAWKMQTMTPCCDCAAQQVWQQCAAVHDGQCKKRKLDAAYGCPLEGDQLDSMAGDTASLHPASLQQQEAFLVVGKTADSMRTQAALKHP